MVRAGGVLKHLVGPLILVGCIVERQGKTAGRDRREAEEIPAAKFPQPVNRGGDCR